MVQGTERLMGLLERRGPLFGDIGGLLLFAFWMTQARQSGLPAIVAAALHLATMATVMMAVLGYQFAQGSAPSAWLGWAGAATIGLGFGGALSMVAAGLVLFGISIVRCGVHPKLPGWLLAAAGVVLLWSLALAPGFGRAWGNLSAGWSLLMAAPLVVVAAALADLDVIERAREHRESRVTA